MKRGDVIELVEVHTTYDARKKPRTFGACHQFHFVRMNGQDNAECIEQSGETFQIPLKLLRLAKAKVPAAAY